MELPDDIEEERTLYEFWNESGKSPLDCHPTEDEVINNLIAEAQDYDDDELEHLGDFVW